MNVRLSRHFRQATTWLAAFSCLAFAHIDAATASTAVNFAGFAYVGDSDTTTVSYPYTTALEAEAHDGVSVLDAALRHAVSGVTNDTFTLVFDQLSSVKSGSGSAIVLAFALDRETVSVEQIAQDYKLLVELSGQALFVDFRELAVVASYPVVVQFIDVKSSPPSNDDVAATVRDLYLGTGPDGIFSNFSKTLANVRLNTAVQRRLRVTKAVMSDEAWAALQRTDAESRATLEAGLAQDFSKFLSANQQVPVLPPSKGHAIGNRMATRFADGSVYMLRIPEADYAIELSLDELRKVEYAKTAVGTSFVYGAFLSVNVLEPLSGKTYFDARLRNGATKVVPATQVSVDDAAAFQDTLLALMDKFTSALGKPDPGWAEKHTGDKTNVRQMKALDEVLLSCR